MAAAIAAEFDIYLLYFMIEHGTTQKIHIKNQNKYKKVTLVNYKRSKNINVTRFKIIIQLTQNI